MQQSKLVKVLRTFAKADWKALRLRLQSPLHIRPRESVQLLALLTILEKASPDFSKVLTNKNKLQKQLEKQFEINKIPLDKWMSKLLRQAEEVLLDIQRSAEDDSSKQLQLARVLRQRTLPGLEEATLRKIDQQLAKSAIKGRDFHWMEFQLKEAWLTHPSRSTPQLLSESLRATEHALDRWYLLAKLEQAVWRTAQRIQLQTDDEDSLLPQQSIFALIKSEQLQDLPVHQIYYYAYRFLTAYEHTDLDSYQQLSTLMQAHGTLLEPDKRKALQTILRIYAAGRYNRGEDEFLPIMYRLYQDHLKAGELYDAQGYLHAQTLLNLVLIGLRSGEVQSVQQLLDHHQQRIHPSMDSNLALRFNRALVAFYARQWEEAMALLDNTYPNPFYTLAARRLELMLYYEQQSPILWSRVEAFKVYIHRQGKQKLTPKVWALNNNFVDLLRQILHPSTAHDTDRIQRLLDKAKSTSSIAERAWLQATLSNMMMN